MTERLDVYIAPTPDQAQAIVDSDAAELRRYVFRQYDLIGWNSRRPQLADKRVRQALTKGTNRQEIRSAMIRASVVFPEPGGPQKISDGTRPSSIARRRNPLAPTRSSCPTISSSVEGRTRSASGARPPAGGGELS